MTSLPLALHTGDRLSLVVGIALALLIIGVILYVGFHILLYGGIILWAAFRRPGRLILSFFVFWAIFSAPMWVFYGGRVAYGWAAAAAMVVATVSSALGNLSDE